MTKIHPASSSKNPVYTIIQIRHTMNEQDKEAKDQIGHLRAPTIRLLEAQSSLTDAYRAWNGPSNNTHTQRLALYRQHLVEAAAHIMRAIESVDNATQQPEENTNDHPT